MTLIDHIEALGRQLYPTGRAFKMPFGGWFDKLNRAMARYESRAYTDALSLLNTILPDNIHFTVFDAADWERRLGLSGTGTLAQRKAAIIRKMNHPGTARYRQSYRFLQGQLIAAGFTDVYVYENRFLSGGVYITRSPIDAFGGGGVIVQHGDIEHGDTQHGSYWSDLVVNYLEPERDAVFDLGSNLFSTFFISGSSLNTTGSCPAARRTELRELILRIKPAQTVAFLNLNYI